MLPLEALRAYAIDAADVNAVMRTLCSHDGWLAPAVMFEGDSEFERLVVLSEEIELPDRELWLFTDESCARQCAASFPRLGVLAAELSAERAFSLLADRFDSLVINPGCPEDQRWFAGAGAFGLVGQWVEGLAIERQLPELPRLEPALLKRIAEFAGVSMPVQGENAVALPGFAGFEAAGVVCTTPDSGKAFFDKLPPQLRETLQWATGPGHLIFAALAAQQFDGLVFNPVGPGPQVAVPMEVAGAIATAAAL